MYEKILREVTGISADRILSLFGGFFTTDLTIALRCIDEKYHVFGIIYKMYTKTENNR